MNDNARSIVRSEQHKIRRPLPEWLHRIWARIRGYGHFWLEPCDRCGQRAMLHYAPSSLFRCLRFEPIRVKR